MLLSSVYRVAHVSLSLCAVGTVCTSCVPPTAPWAPQKSLTQQLEPSLLTAERAKSTPSQYSTQSVAWRDNMAASTLT